jgi:hypothetical protein
MRIKTLLFFAFVVGVSFASQATRAQEKSGELWQIEDRLIQSVGQQFDGWKHISVAPIEGSYDVVINQWSIDNKSARVTIIRHRSEEEARTKLRSLATTLKALKTMTDSGDEQYVRPNTSGSVIYQKQQFTVNIDIESTDAQEQKNMIKELSKLASRAITKT